MSATKSVLIAAGAGIVTEAAVWWLCTTFHHGEWDAFDLILFYSHFPGMIIADSQKLSGVWQLVFMVVTGFIQWFLIFLLALSVWNRTHKHEKPAA
jgi:hypothetical protein